MEVALARATTGLGALLLMIAGHVRADPTSPTKNARIPQLRRGVRRPRSVPARSSRARSAPELIGVAPIWPDHSSHPAIVLELLESERNRSNEVEAAANGDRAGRSA